MHYCDDNNGIVLNSVIDAEWKPVYQRASRVSVNNWISEWGFGYRFECRQYLVEKLMAQPGQSFLIPVC